MYGGLYRWGLYGKITEFLQAVSGVSCY